MSHKAAKRLRGAGFAKQRRWQAQADAMITSRFNFGDINHDLDVKISRKFYEPRLRLPEPQPIIKTTPMTQPNQPEQDAAIAYYDPVTKRVCYPDERIGSTIQREAKRKQYTVPLYTLEDAAKINALRAAEKPTCDAAEVTDADVDLIEDRLGMAHGGWDMVDPKEIVRVARATAAPSSDALAVAIHLLRLTQRDYQSSNSLGLYSDIRDFLAKLGSAAARGSAP